MWFFTCINQQNVIEGKKLEAGSPHINQKNEIDSKRFSEAGNPHINQQNVIDGKKFPKAVSPFINQFPEALSTCKSVKF